MRLHLIAGLTAGLLALGAAPALADVGVRVEGAGGTLLPLTTVAQSSAPAPDTGCPGTSAAAALQAATAGNWDHQVFAQTIMGETHAFANDDYWAEWIGHDGVYTFGAKGICDDLLAPGDELLMIADVSGPPPGYLATVRPLSLRLPAAAALTAGAAVTVTVVDFSSDPATTGQASPVAGATVSGGAAPVTTGADGTATITLGPAGAATLKATKAGLAPSAGTPIAVLPRVSCACAPPFSQLAPDTKAPVGAFASLRDGAALKTGPRRLGGSFDDTAGASEQVVSGVKTIQLRLRRRVSGHCSTYSGTRERFRPVRCGKGSYFKLPAATPWGAAPTWSYLLPKPLAKGRYVLDAVAIDGAGNRTPLSRNQTRVVFTVR